MNTTSLLIAQIGFVLLTIVYFLLLLRQLFTGVDSTQWAELRKTRFKRFWIIGLCAWMAFVTAWSMSGVMSDFSIFPFNFVPVIAIPLIVILVLTFNRSMTEVLN